MYGIIYKITNLINNKIYIGQTIKKCELDGKSIKTQQNEV